MALNDDICQLVDYACMHLLLDPADRLWAYNRLLEAVGATGPGPEPAWLCTDVVPESETESMIAPPARYEPLSDLLQFDEILEHLCTVACEHGVERDSAAGRDRCSTRLMGIVTPRPSVLTATFAQLAKSKGPAAATTWWYTLCEDAGYVRRSAYARTIRWHTASPWGVLDITINRSKPEKDPRDIAAAFHEPVDSFVGMHDLRPYPRCQLCRENEGYSGRLASESGGEHPARQNLRIIPLELQGQRWGFQYSPYAYFPEHCIVMSAQHRPMHIDQVTFACLFDFVDLIPHYMIGSNADLPIVGGSILTHDHFQGGAYEFPLMRAAVNQVFSLPAYPHVQAGVLTWPMSVIRLRSAHRHEILAAATQICTAWRAYSDESVGIVSKTPDGEAHTTVTPIVRRIDAQGIPGGNIYEVFLALRCNITSDEHPLGVFHPHEQWHHIKKENIGLIEVMGLAILPARLAPELTAVQAHMLARDTEALMSDPKSRPHALWAQDIMNRHSDIDESTIDHIMRDEVGLVFSHVLEDAGVFKWDEQGRAAQMRFIATLYS